MQASLGHLSAIKKLAWEALQNNTSLNPFDSSKITPLAMAAQENQKQVVKFYTKLKNRTDLNPADSHGDTVIDFAGNEGHAEIVTLLSEELKQNPIGKGFNSNVPPYLTLMFTFYFRKMEQDCIASLGKIWKS